MPKKKTPEENPKDQFKRFLEVAREHGVDDKDAVKEKFRRLAQPPKGTRRAEQKNDK